MREKTWISPHCYFYPNTSLAPSPSGCFKCSVTVTAESTECTLHSCKSNFIRACVPFRLTCPLTSWLAESRSFTAACIESAVAGRIQTDVLTKQQSGERFRGTTLTILKWTMVGHIPGSFVGPLCCLPPAATLQTCPTWAARSYPTYDRPVGCTSNAWKQRLVMESRQLNIFSLLPPPRRLCYWFGLSVCLI